MKEITGILLGMSTLEVDTKNGSSMKIRAFIKTDNGVVKVYAWATDVASPKVGKKCIAILEQKGEYENCTFLG